MKTCTKCEIEKAEDNFGKDSTKKDGLCCQCKECKKEYYIKNKPRFEKYYIENRERIIEQNTKYNKSNREKIKTYMKEYCIKNKYSLKEYVLENRDKLSEYKRDYNKLHREEHRKYDKEWKDKKRKSDPIFKLRMNISNSINIYLRKKNSCKFGKSMIEYLPYSLGELREHLENQFESWMNWDNWGVISLEKRTWQIDHIIPQSSLPYTSMEDENFRKCWSLENLRPLEAIENIKKSNKILGKKDK
jgi:hypothetical protein